MKISNSKKQLAKIIHENGGWREGAEFTAQDGDGTGSIDFFKSKPRLYKGDIFWKGDYDCDDRIERTGVTIKNWHQTILSRAEYFHLYPAPDADGWIEWEGGECPVGIDEIVDVRRLDGGTYTARAVNFHWLLKSGSVSVASYRPHKPEAKPEFCESVMRSIPEPESIDGLCAKVTEENKHQHVDAKPTIEKLVQDYYNAKDYANRKQDEADKANMESDAALAQLEDAIAEIGFAITPLVAPEKEPELVITDWQDLRVGDEIEVFNFECPWNKSSRKQELMSGPCIVMRVEGENVLIELKNNLPTKGPHWNATGLDACDFKFIRRP